MGSLNRLFISPRTGISPRGEIFFVYMHLSLWGEIYTFSPLDETKSYISVYFTTKNIVFTPGWIWFSVYMLKTAYFTPLVTCKQYKRFLKRRKREHPGANFTSEWDNACKLPLRVFYSLSFLSILLHLL